MTDDMKNKKTFESDNEWQRVVWLGTIVKPEEYEEVKEFLVDAFDAIKDKSQVEIIGTINTKKGVTEEGERRQDFVFAIHPETISRFAIERLEKMPDMKWMGDYYDAFEEDLPGWLRERLGNQQLW